MISIIIPALNEELHIERCIESLLAEGFSDTKEFISKTPSPSPSPLEGEGYTTTPPLRGGDEGEGDVCGFTNDRVSEIIIADGGSRDRTKEIASGYRGVRVVESAQGRGTQMNAGSATAINNILLFLHADTVLERGWSKELSSVFADASVIGGAFSFRIDNPALKYRLVEAWVRLRCRFFGLPYGDQAIFIRRDAFQKLGGYKEIPIMEDVDIVRRMKNLGRIVMLQNRAVTSGRRWVSKGLFRTAAINQMTMLMYHLGVSPERLARFYYQ